MSVLMQKSKLELYTKKLEQLSLNEGTPMNLLVAKSVRAFISSKYTPGSEKEKKYFVGLSLKITKQFEKLRNEITRDKTLKPTVKKKLLSELTGHERNSTNRFNIWTTAVGLRSKPGTIIMLAAAPIGIPAASFRAIMAARTLPQLARYAYGATLSMMESGGIYNLARVSAGSVGLVPMLQKIPEMARLIASRNGVLLARDMVHSVMTNHRGTAVLQMEQNIVGLIQRASTSWLPRTMQIRNINQVNLTVYKAEVETCVKHCAQIFRNNPVPEPVLTEFGRHFGRR